MPIDTAAAQPLSERAIKRGSIALATIADHTNKLNAQIDRAVAPKVDPAVAAQIRSHWANKEGGALSGLMEVITAGDATTASAVLTAPAYLSGLKDENITLLREAAARTLAPELVAQRDAAQRAHTRVGRAVEGFMTTVGPKLRTWQDNDDKTIRARLGE